MNDLRPTGKLRFYLTRMAARGFSAERVLDGTGLRAESSEEALCHASPHQYRQIIKNMMKLTCNPYIGIALGQEFKLSDLGILGYASLSASTLMQSRELYDRCRSLNSYIFTSRNHISDGRWMSEIQDNFGLADVMHFAVEEFVSQTIELASALTRKAFPILELHVTYPQPPDVSGYISRFKCPLYFNQPRNIVVFDINCLRDRISLANAEVFNLCSRQCEILAAERDGNVPLSELIRNYLVAHPSEFPTLEAMADHLKIGARTLRRRLVIENLTYQKVLDDTRKDLAIQYLKMTNLAPKEIGYLLGYSSVSNFRRAFKGWVGHTLSEVRHGVDESGETAYELTCEDASEKSYSPGSAAGRGTRMEYRVGA